MSNSRVGFLATLLMVGAMSAPAFAQTTPDQTAPATPPAAAGGVGGGAATPAPEAGAPGGGGPGGGGQNRWNPQAMRQRMIDRLKQQLGTSDDEFAAIQPKIEKVMQLKREVNGPGMFGGRRGGGGGFGGAGGPGGDPNQTPSAVQQATKDLQETLDDANATPADIKTKLDALRDARGKAMDDLVKAQQDLSDVLTQRQEAVLVMMGILD
jgi:hypothetical protein